MKFMDMLKKKYFIVILNDNDLKKGFSKNKDCFCMILY